jgi:hypothetical protein
VKKVEVVREPDPPVRTVVVPVRPVPTVVYQRPPAFARPVGVRLGFAGGGGPIGFVGRRRF